MTSRRDQEADAPRRGERIAKLLARAGIASRREVERMIDEGRIAQGGTVLTTPNTVLPSLAGVTVDGKPVAAPAPARLFLYHKPVGLLVTERDPKGRPTIYDRLPKELPRVVPVGRLDLNTEGLLLLTTDGELKRQLELPATGVERTYRARAYGQVSQAQLEELIEGVEIEGIRYGQIDANLERRTGANVWIEMTLTEGKNREVRRVLEHLGLQVGRLIRTRYGPFVLGDLAPGEVGEARPADLVAFRQARAGKRSRPMDPIAPTPVRERRSEAGPTQSPATNPPRHPGEGRGPAATRRQPLAKPADSKVSRPRPTAEPDPGPRRDDGRRPAKPARPATSGAATLSRSEPGRPTHSSGSPRRSGPSTPRPGQPSRPPRGGGKPRGR